MGLFRYKNTLPLFHRPAVPSVLRVGRRRSQRKRLLDTTLHYYVVGDRKTRFNCNSETWVEHTNVCRCAVELNDDV